MTRYCFADAFLAEQYCGAASGALFALRGKKALLSLPRNNQNRFPRASAFAQAGKSGFRSFVQHHPGRG
jgi:hypothetical protein